MNETETIQHRTIIKLTEELAAKDKEIEELRELRNSDLLFVTKYNIATICNNEHKSRITVLEAELAALRNQAGEPVAWRYEECSYTGKGLGTYLLSPTLLGKNSSLLINPTPLYAHPASQKEE